MTNPSQVQDTINPSLFNWNGAYGDIVATINKNFNMNAWGKGVFHD